MKLAALLPALTLLSLPTPTRGPAPARETVDILITRGTVITMDSARRVLEDGAVAIRGDRIVAVGPSAALSARFTARQTIDAARKIVMPGLIDGHGHAGHGLVKTLGMDTEQWYGATETVYARGSTVDFWRAEALLTGVERVRFGVTTALSFFGGGDMVVRTDDRRYGDAYLAAIDTVGLRFILAVGPRRPPFPRTYTDWSSGSPREYAVTFARQLEVSETLIKQWNGAGAGRLHVAVMFPTHHPETMPDTGAAVAEIKAQALAARALSRRYGVLFTEDGHSRGTIKWMHEQLGILGPDVLLSHATGMTDEEIGIVARTGTKIVHNPSANAAMREPFRLIELLDAGATVMLGSDGVAPDRSYDMFRHMFQAMRYHRAAFRDTNVLPAGKVLEMVTIDAARALGLEREIGSLEPGKKADVILIDAFRPHMVPMNMPLYRVAYFANGNDVSTVLVNGRVLMRDRRVLSVNEESVLTFAEREANAAIRRSGLEPLMQTPDGFWGRSRLPKRP
ncbi:MAG: amidohydrolase family protein [Gemmatimonadota bacterium]|nr:amidohydrolase family protein [Gemmatimonadota bacterium]